MSPVESPSCAHSNFIFVGARVRAPKCDAAWECPPSRGRATDAREKESPLAILRPEGRGPASYPGLGNCVRLARFDSVKSMNRLSWAENPKDE
ncbi:hypothetical protein CRG98_003651 [Punica granatum]|uniref:Uncharacterized protein n=1 Tax=Punica granatum TaxID=22663 RepID=A0A2I0L5V7_PUNGR|nr:hypothetical protein CRG98_003651 [Punica granatum]